jgi:membrane protein implicated in regulation of membrane protease activity
MQISLTIVWLILAIVLAIVELATLGLVTIWFAIGAVVACFASYFGADMVAQLVLFVVVSGVILLVVRPMAEKHVNKMVKKTNIDALTGRKLIVKDEIDNLRGTGKVDIDGSTWLASSDIDAVTIGKGEEVEVIKVVGARVIVKRVVD